MDDIDADVEAEFEAQLAAGLLPQPLPATVRLTWNIEQRGVTLHRSCVVPRPDVNAVIDRLLARGAFNFNV